MSRMTFFLDGMEYLAVRGPKDIVLITRGRITAEQYDEAFTLAKKAFAMMDRSLSHSMREWNELPTTPRVS